MRQIIPMICDRIVVGLTQACITEVSFSELSRVNEIKVGRYQEDPSKTHLRLSVQGGDVEDIEIQDGIVSYSDPKNDLAFSLPAREIGGGEMWYRRGIVGIELFFVIESSNETPSREAAYLVLARIQSKLPTIKVSDLIDDFGERAVKLFSTRNTLYQSGGPPTSWIWRGKVVWECLTERS